MNRAGSHLITSSGHALRAYRRWRQRNSTSGLNIVGLALGMTRTPEQKACARKGTFVEICGAS